MSYKFQPGTLIEIREDLISPVFLSKGTIGVIIEICEECSFDEVNPCYKILMENKILIISEYCLKRLKT